MKTILRLLVVGLIGWAGVGWWFTFSSQPNETVPANSSGKSLVNATAVCQEPAKQGTIPADQPESAKSSPQAELEFDLPKRPIKISEAIVAGPAVSKLEDWGALLNDPTFLEAVKRCRQQTAKNEARGDRKH